MSHTAVILIALGGPRNLDEVGQFMTAFMGRPAPQPVVAAVVERYKLTGGGSPLPKLVAAQAQALQRELGGGFRVYEGFRYSAPSIEDAVGKAASDGADGVIGLSMSPFETTATTGLYRAAFEATDAGAAAKTFVPSWHDHPHFIDAWVERVEDGLKRFRETVRRYTAVIFTSHSIPVRYIAAGDPYQRQIEETVRLVAARAGAAHWRIAWQSKGARATEPWLEPEVETVLDALAAERKFQAVLEVPVGFTCDHMETLYDIEIVHRRHAGKLGLAFERAESLNTSALLIKALTDIVRKAAHQHPTLDRRGPKAG
jgi:protoporphyrin/coproporphyrin ferrochelatase